MGKEQPPAITRSPKPSAKNGDRKPLAIESTGSRCGAKTISSEFAASYIKAADHSKWQ